MGCCYHITHQYHFLDSITIVCGCDGLRGRAIFLDLLSLEISRLLWVLQYWLLWCDQVPVYSAEMRFSYGVEHCVCGRPVLFPGGVRVFVLQGLGSWLARVQCSECQAHRSSLEFGHILFYAYALSSGCGHLGVWWDMILQWGLWLICIVWCILWGSRILLECCPGCDSIVATTGFSGLLWWCSWHL